MQLLPPKERYNFTFFLRFLTVWIMSKSAEDYNAKPPPPRPPLPMERVTLYPAGGDFNKLRQKQSFLNDLLTRNVEGYVNAVEKKEYLKTEIIDQIPGGLWLWEGNNVQDDGSCRRLDDDEAFQRLRLCGILWHKMNTWWRSVTSRSWKRVFCLSLDTFG